MGTATDLMQQNMRQTKSEVSGTRKAGKGHQGRRRIDTKSKQTNKCEEKICTMASQPFN